MDMKRGRDIAHMRRGEEKEHTSAKAIAAIEQYVTAEIAAGKENYFRGDRGSLVGVAVGAKPSYYATERQNIEELQAILQEAGVTDVKIATFSEQGGVLYREEVLKQHIEERRSAFEAYGWRSQQSIDENLQLTQEMNSIDREAIMGLALGYPEVAVKDYVDFRRLQAAEVPLFQEMYSGQYDASAPWAEAHRETLRALQDRHENILKELQSVPAHIKSAKRNSLLRILAREYRREVAGIYQEFFSEELAALKKSPEDVAEFFSRVIQIARPDRADESVYSFAVYTEDAMKDPAISALREHVANSFQAQ